MDPEVKKTIRRIEQMEELYDQVRMAMVSASDMDNYAQQEMISVLSQYYESGQWLKDYEADERGELPTSLKRGILSQDSLYDLLCEIDKLHIE